MHEFRILGPLEVVADDGALAIPGPRCRAVLAVLVVFARQTVSLARLVDEVWGERPPASAGNVVQGHVSDLRRLLGRTAIETRGDAYVLHVPPGARDLDRFERLAGDGAEALDAGRPQLAAEAFGRALDLWRGPALGDLPAGGTLGPEAMRLDELRLHVLERRLEAELQCGRGGALVGELRGLVAEHPLRETLRAQLALALYRAGRPVEALDGLRDARRWLAAELGLDPGPRLKALERAILEHDPSLSGSPASAPPPRGVQRSVVVAPLDAGRAPALLELAAPLVARSGRELLLALLVAAADGLPAASRQANGWRDELLGRGVAARAASFVSADAAADVARLAREHDADLLLVDAPPGLLADARVAAVLDGAACDVALLAGTPGPGPVLVAFSGAEHDWAAVEVGAWLASARGGVLQLAGSADDGTGRDASRMLASASLAVQRAVGVAAEPLLVPPGADGLVAAAAGTGVVVAGLSRRWQRDGLGRVRTALARRDGATLLVRRGARPGGLAPAASETRFTWTIAAEA